TIDAVSWRRDPAAQHQFDVCCAALDLLAHRSADGRFSVADGAQPGVRVARLERSAAAAARITVTARLRQRVSAEDHTRTFEQAFLDGLGETEVGATRVADGGEATPQHALQDGA